MGKKLFKSLVMVKTFLFIIAIISILILNNCQYFEQLSYKEWKEISGANDGVDIYIGGYYNSGGYYPCCWKNEEFVILTLESYSAVLSDVKSICLDGDDIYCGGCYANGSVSNACYWKNDEHKKVELDNPGIASYIYSIAVTCGVVFACGYEDSKACYWINGKKYSLNTPSGATASYARSIAVDNETLDFYIAGIYNTSTDYACWWKNGSECVTLYTPYTGVNYRAYTLTVSNGKVYIGGYVGSPFVPCYWIDGKCVELPFSSSGYVYAISIYDGSVYCAGINSDGSNRPALWKDTSNLWTDTTTIGTLYGLAAYDGDTYATGSASGIPYCYKNREKSTLYPYSNAVPMCIAVRFKR